MGSAAFLGVILSNWATPWTEQTCGGGMRTQRSGTLVFPQGYSHRHNDLSLARGCVSFDEPLGDPRRCRSLNRAGTCVHTLPGANHTKFNLIRVVSPHAPLRSSSGADLKVPKKR